MVYKDATYKPKIYSNQSKANKYYERKLQKEAKNADIRSVKTPQGDS